MKADGSPTGSKVDGTRLRELKLSFLKAHDWMYRVVKQRRNAKGTAKTEQHIARADHIQRTSEQIAGTDNSGFLFYHIPS